jgi:hypothetical protein
MISEPGIYTLPADQYHADPCLRPSLSSSIAKTLIEYSAKHAWFAHPRLNPNFVRKAEAKFDLGTAAHAYVLEGETNTTIVRAANWQTKIAKVARAEARLAGKIALLEAHWAGVQAMEAALRTQLRDYVDRPIPLTHGTAERVIVWKEGELYCRARLDWLHADQVTIDDYKTTGGSANPEEWSRTLFNMGFDVQEAFYRRGLRAVNGGKTPTFRFIVQETFPPYELVVMALPPEAADMAERKVQYAINLWTECLARNAFPGYPKVTCWADVPPWEAARWQSQELRRPLDDGRPAGQQLLEEEREADSP